MMQGAEDKPRWYFVDEAGDPAFYGKGKEIIVGREGCSRVFSVGFLRTHDPQLIRSKLADVRLEVLGDRYLKAVPSIQKSLRAFHAKDDCPEVRKLVFGAVEKMDFAVQVIVGRKVEYRFRGTHGGSQDRFYDDLVGRLFERQLHLSVKNTIVFATRGNKTRQHALRTAVEAGVQKFRRSYGEVPVTSVQVLTSQPAQEPVLQAVDYCLWTIQRAFERGEMRYFEFLREKIELVWDVFDVKKIQRQESTIYDRKRNPFDIKKVSPLS
ncbi:MAG: DUF3800 domain-containing protein [Terriglobales bacterium]